jgi:hypothetical protein
MISAAYRAVFSALCVFGAIFAFGSGQALAQSGPTPNTYIAVDGAFPCLIGETAASRLGYKLGESGCAPRLGVELGRTGAPTILGADLWVLRLQYGKSKDSEGVTFPTFATEDSFTDKRLTLDAELGWRMRMAWFGGTHRATLGLRYGYWHGDLVVDNAPTAEATETPPVTLPIEPIGPRPTVIGPTRPIRPRLVGLGLLQPVGIAPSIFSETISTHTLGMRFGWRSTIPLSSHWMIETNTGAAILVGRASRRFEASDLPEADEARRTGLMYSIDTTALLSYRLNGSDTGPIASLGVTAEAWLNQTANPSFARANHFDRFSWGPIARLRVPLGQ